MSDTENTNGKDTEQSATAEASSQQSNTVSNTDAPIWVKATSGFKTRRQSGSKLEAIQKIIFMAE